MKVTETTTRLLLAALFASSLGSAAALATDAGDGSVADPEIVGTSAAVDKALQVELTAAGLATVADVLRTTALGNLKNVVVPDVSQDIFGGIKLGLSGVRASLAVDSLAVVPLNGQLGLDVGLRDVKVSIAQLDIRKDVFGWNLGATCTDTVFHIGERGVVHFKMNLAPSVDHTDIALAASNVKFQVSSSNYRIAGPAACSGPLIGLIERTVLHEALVLVRPFLQTLVADKIKKTMPTIAKLLNDQAHISANIDLQGLPALPVVTAGIQAYPSSITVDGKALRLALGIRITREPLSILKDRHYRLGAGPLRFGSVGINPSLITAAFATLWPAGSDYYDVSKLASALLDLPSMAAVWPDLTRLTATDKHMRLQIRLAAAPELVADGASQAVLAHLPDVELKFQVSVNHAWTDYYLIHLNLKTGAQATITTDHLAISLLANSSVSITGNWAPGYVPADPTFEADVAQALFTGLVQLMTSGGPIMQQTLPELNIQGHTLLLAAPHIEAPYVAVDVTGQ